MRLVSFVWIPLQALALVSVALFGCSHEQKKDLNWPREALTFLEPFTSKNGSWSSSDFGDEVTAADQALLQRFRPQLWIGPNSTAPVDFYSYYLANSTLRTRDGEIVAEAPTRQQLKDHERSYGHFLQFHGNAYPCLGNQCAQVSPVLYAAAFHEQTQGEGWWDRRPVTILRYSAVFPASGLPMGMSWMQSAVTSLAGKVDEWHQLDIHGAYYLIVDDASQKPMVAMLAQHNHFRVFAVGSAEWPSPADDRAQICYADRSNEPYPCSLDAQPVSFPATGHPSKLRWVFTGKDRPMDGAYDIVYGQNSGGTSLTPELKFLPSRDPLYVAWINLGDLRKLFGIFPTFSRFGPPGMDLNRFPKLKTYMDVAAFYSFDPNDSQAFSMVEEGITNYFDADVKPIIDRNSKNFRERVAAAFIPHLTGG